MSTSQEAPETRRTVSLQDVGVPLAVSYALLLIAGAVVGPNWQGLAIFSIILCFCYIGPLFAFGVLVNNAVSAHPVATLGSLWHVVPAITIAAGLAYFCWRIERRWLRLSLLSVTATLWAAYGFYCLGLVGFLSA